MAREEYIDVIKLKEQLANRTIWDFIKQPNVIANLTAIACFEAAVITGANPVLNLCYSLMALYNLKRIRNKKEIFNSHDYLILRALEKTNVYRRMSENYFTFVHYVAKFTKEFGFKSSKETLLFLEQMLNTGYMSHTKHHEYHKYEYDFGEQFGTSGAQVITGKSVCRHAASIFSDILYKINADYSACNVVVDGVKENEMEKYLNPFHKKEFNHAVVGIVEGDERYLYDPTKSDFASKTSLNSAFVNDGNVAETIGDTKYYYFLSKDKTSLNKLHMDESKKFYKANFISLDADEIDDMRAKMVIFFIDNIGYINEFFRNNLELLEEINRDVNMVAPKSDEKIKEWILKY